MAAYLYDKSFSPVIPLPFPVVTSEKALAGSLVTGLSLLLKNDPPESAIIQSGVDQTYLMFMGGANINLKEFNLSDELERLSASVNPLIKRQEAGDVSREDKK